MKYMSLWMEVLEMYDSWDEVKCMFLGMEVLEMYEYVSRDGYVRDGNALLRGTVKSIRQFRLQGRHRNWY